MRIQEFKKYFIVELSGSYPETEIQSFFNLLVVFQLNLTRATLAIQPNFKLDKNNLDFFKKALINLKNHIPIQYILGETEFYGLTFNVNSHVLIPRPETEELVSWILKDFKNTKNAIKILDIGTGSGCIAIALAKNIPNATVFAIDVSAKALEVAKKNATLNAVNIHFIEENILDNPQLNTNNKLDMFDVIVSNPPYVRELEKEQMQQNVLENEPHLALFVKNNNPLLFYTKISEIAKIHLTKNGVLYFEINQYLGKKITDLLQLKNFKNIELKKDIYQADRMVKAINNT